MTKKLSIGFALASPLLAVGACQVGIGSDAVDISGQRGALIAAGAEGSVVCVDANGSFGCDATEAQTVAAKDGSYDLDALFPDGEAFEDASVIAVLKHGAEDDAKSTTLAAVRGRPELISGATNLVYHLTTGKDAMSEDAAWSTVKASYGLDKAVALTAEAHAPDSRLGNLAGYLVSHARVSAEGADDLAGRQAAVRSVINATGSANQLLNALAAPAAGNGSFTVKALADDGVRPTDTYENMAFTQGMKFGAGWNDVMSTVMGNTQCLEPYTMFSNNAFNEAFTLHTISDKSQLTKELDISGKIALDLGTFNATIEGQFYNLMDVDENYVYILAKNEIVLRDFHIANPKMTLDGFGDCGAVDANNRCINPDGTPGPINNRFGTQVGSVREKFKRAGEDFAAFRDKCGDRYINTITTGGAYYGMLVVKTSSQQEKETIAATLDAKISETMSAQGSMKLLFNELSDMANTEIVIMKRGTQGSSTLVVTPEQFMADLDAFHQNMCNIHPDKCGTVNEPVPETDWTRAPFRVKYETYAPIADTQQGGDVAAQRAAMNKFVSLVNQYEALRSTIQNMRVFYFYYNGALERDEELAAREEEVNDQLAIVRDLYEMCNREVGGICIQLRTNEELDLYGLKPARELKLARPDRPENWAALPTTFKRFPKTCQEYKEVNPILGSTDGNKIVYMNGDAAKMFWLYCQDMDTTSPTNYLTLARYDGPDHNASENFSQFAFQYADGTSKTLTTVYDRLKVFVNQDVLKVDVTGQANCDPAVKQCFHATIGGPIVEPITNTTHKIAKFATGKSCFVAAPEPADDVRANIDLRGTPFKLSAATTFQTPDPEVELVTAAKTWYAANLDAVARQGRLAIVHDETENGRLRQLLDDYRMVDAWLGIHATTGAERQFVWTESSSNYFNFENTDITTWLRAPGNNRVDYCAVVTANQGYYQPAACRTQARPYFVEYRKTTGDGLQKEIPDFEQNGQVWDLSVSDQLGCGTVQPAVQLALQYDQSLVTVVNGGIPAPGH